MSDAAPAAALSPSARTHARRGVARHRRVRHRIRHRLAQASGPAEVRRVRRRIRRRLVRAGADLPRRRARVRARRGVIIGPARPARVRRRRQQQPAPLPAPTSHADRHAGAGRDARAATQAAQGARRGAHAHADRRAHPDTCGHDLAGAHRHIVGHPDPGAVAPGPRRGRRRPASACGRVCLSKKRQNSGAASKPAGLGGLHPDGGHGRAAQRAHAPGLTTNRPRSRSRSPRSGLPRHANRESAYHRSSAGTWAAGPASNASVLLTTGSREAAPVPAPRSAFTTGSRGRHRLLTCRSA